MNGIEPRSKSIPKTGLSLILTVILGILFLLSLTVGRVGIDLTDILDLTLQHIRGVPSENPVNTPVMVLWHIRLPRCIMAMVVGVGLSVSGAVYQAMFRNPLVSPDILGVAAGCTVGAALGLILPDMGFAQVHVMAFAFGLLAVFMTVSLARLIAVRQVVVLILSGMVIMSFFNALLMIIKYFSDPYDELPSIVFWIMGSLTRSSWHHVVIALPLTLLGTALFMVLRFRLNILSLGDIQTRALGMNPGIYRMVLIITGSLVVAMIVAACGQISWIGLIIPHMARTLVGPDHRKMLPITALMGGIFMLGADMAARCLTAAEIPVGILTALTGAPCFGYLLFRNRRNGWL